MSHNITQIYQNTLLRKLFTNKTWIVVREIVKSTEQHTAELKLKSPEAERHDDMTELKKH